MASTQRLFYVDLIKAFGITLVILGHIQNHGDLYLWITSFHMPLFFMISGFFFIKPDVNIKTHLKKRWVNLIVPYLFFYILTYGYWAGIEQNLRASSGGVSAEWWRPLIGLLWQGCDWNLFPHNNPLWFIPCLCSVELIAFASRKWSKVKQGILACGLVVCSCILREWKVILPFELDLALSAFFFYWMGGVVCKIVNSRHSLIYGIGCVIVYISTLCKWGGVRRQLFTAKP